MTHKGKVERARKSTKTGEALCIDPGHPSTGITFRVTEKEPGSLSRLETWCKKYSRQVQSPCHWLGTRCFYVTIDITAQQAFYHQASRYGAEVRRDADPFATVHCLQEERQEQDKTGGPLWDFVSVLNNHSPQGEEKQY